MFVVCGRNVALGVFTSMGAAIASVMQSDPDAEIWSETDDGCFVELQGKGEDTYTVVKLVQTEPFKLITPLFSK